MLTTSDIAQVLSHYDLGNLASMIQASRGYVNETSIVQTAEQRVVVRRNHRGLNEAAQRYRHQLIARLHEHDFPTPRLIPTHEGDTLLIENGRSFEVMPFIRGDDYNTQRPQQQYYVGVMLAQYHLIVKHMPPPPDAARHRYSPHSMMGLTEMLIKQDMMGDLTDMLSWYDLRAAKLRSRLSDSAYDALPHVVIHGDIHRDNVLFSGDKVAALLDFDQVAWDTPVADLADALVAFASVDKPKTLGWGVFPGPLDAERFDRVMAGYMSVAPLSAAEINALPILLEVLWLKGELGRVISTAEGAPDYHLAVLQQGRQLAQWLEDHRDRLIGHWLNMPPIFSNRITASAA